MVHVMTWGVACERVWCGAAPRRANCGWWPQYILFRPSPNHACLRRAKRLSDTVQLKHASTGLYPVQSLNFDDCRRSRSGGSQIHFKLLLRTIRNSLSKRRPVACVGVDLITIFFHLVPIRRSLCNQINLPRPFQNRFWLISIAWCVC